MKNITKIQPGYSKLNILAVFIFSIVVSGSFYVTTAHAQTSGNTIPPGCPGSNQMGPPAPGSCEEYAKSLSRVERCFFENDTNQKIEDCVKQVNVDAFNACISDPNPGQCADNYRSATVDADGNEIDPPPPYTNIERNELKDCKGSPQECLDKNPVRVWILRVVNFLSAGVGIAITIMLIVGGIQYASAGGNPQRVQAAKKKITNAVIALVAYFFVFAFLQWLIPGGLFR